MNDIGKISLAIAKLRKVQNETDVYYDKIESDIILLKNTLLYITREIKEEYENNNS